ncbi:MAG: GLUG motif-containing protein [Candidatus Neomarinimicrobiota bacterium]
MRQFKMLNFLVLTAMLIIPATTALGQGAFAGGSGTAEDPYLVATAAQLDSVRHYLTAYFKQTADIDLNVSPYSEGEGWEPIGTSYMSAYFTGTYDGDGHEIAGLYINRPSRANTGLFGNTSGAKILNLGVVNVNVSGHEKTGALVGYMESGDTLINCYSAGNILGNDYQAGGLIGRAYSSAIINCFSTADVTGGEYYVGGLAGSINGNTHIEACYASGSVTGDYYSVGGLIGLIYSGTVSNSYSLGNVTGGTKVGGFVGDFRYNGTVTHCYSTGQVTGAGSSVGGLVGERPDNLGSRGTLIYSFWDTETSGLSTSAGGFASTSTQMKNPATFIDVDWDFKGIGEEGIWNIGNDRNNGYPYLNWQYPDDPGPAVTSVPAITTEAVTDITETTAVSGGNVADNGGSDVTARGVVWSTSENPTLESNDGFTENGTGVGEFTSEITGLNSNTTYYVRAYATSEIGTGYGENVSFTTAEAAEFAGGSGTESDPLQITTPEHLDNVRNYLGSAHADKHFKLMNDIDLESYLAEGNPGYNDGKFWIPLGDYGSSSGFYGNFDGNGCTVFNLAINSDETYIGFFGYLYEGSVVMDLTIHIDEESAITNASISTSSYTGGLAGYSKGTVTGCSVNGDVYSETPYSGWESIYAGGLIGYLKSPGSVSDCRTDGYVEANGEVGGLVGCSSEAEISESGSGMDVVGDIGYTGGLIGEKWHGTITNCHATGSVESDGDYVGGFIGYCAYDSIMNCFATGNVSGQEMVGGFVGTIYGFTATSSTRIENCFSTGEVTGTDEVGGFAGRNTSANILNSYARGNVHGDNKVGGFLGYNSEGILTNCYSTGKPDGESDIGGFVGSTASWGGTTTGCFWDIESSMLSNSDGGTGKTTAEVKTQSTFTDAGWDFSDIWAINTAKNDGYPCLQWQDDLPTAIEASKPFSSNSGVPDTYVLNNAYPNPFNPTTTISYGLPEPGRVRMVIYNIYGQKIAELVNQTQNAGWYQTNWNGKNQSGVQVSSGVYLCHISIIGQKETFSKNIKMLLTK